MPRFRIEFVKGDEVRFLSHLDVMKAFERAIRRAGIPIAFSEGFNPHPKMNFASALAVGVTSDAEFMDIELKNNMQAAEVKEMLAKALPPGLDVKSGREVRSGAPSLMSVVNRAVYLVDSTLEQAVELGQVKDKLTEFMNRPEIIITKRTKKGPKPKDIKPGILGVDISTEQNLLKLTIMTRTGNEGNVRPEEVVGAFAAHSSLPVDCDSLYIRRLGLYVEKDGKLVSPMEKEVNKC